MIEFPLTMTRSNIKTMDTAKAMETGLTSNSESSRVTVGINVLVDSPAKISVARPDIVLTCGL